MIIIGFSVWISGFVFWNLVVNFLDLFEIVIVKEGVMVCLII